MSSNAFRSPRQVLDNLRAVLKCLERPHPDDDPTEHEQFKQIVRARIEYFEDMVSSEEACTWYRYGRINIHSVD